MTESEQNILVIKLGALGDFMQALGPMKAIRQHHPNAKITLLTTKPFTDLAQKSNYFDEVWIDERPKWHQPLKWLELKKKLNIGQFTRVYDLQNNDRTSLYFNLFHPKPEWVGVAKGASHRNTSPERTAGLAFYGHRQTLALGGIESVEIDNLSWVEADLTQFEIQKPYALIVPGSAANRPEKRWAVENFIWVCEELIKKNIQPVLIGTAAEKDITDAIAKTCDGALDLNSQTSLYDIIALGRDAKCVIGNDTGPMHMIAPTGTPTFVLFTSHSNPKRHAPIGNTVQALLVEDMSKEDVLENVFTKID
ncbi:MAG: glycosyltransferase family 9 protein [Pseudomonadota bacterium]